MILINIINLTQIHENDLFKIRYSTISTILQYL
jgi:hypothetical protein